MKTTWCKRAQNTAEYAILIAVVIGAVMAMQTYIKRSLQGGIKFGVDKATGGKQYEPYYLQSNYVTTDGGSRETETQAAGGPLIKQSDSSYQRTGTQKTLDTSHVGDTE